MKLTPRQTDAVEARGSVAVTAGAGTGKTAMLAARFAHHVDADGFSPLEIAAVTFTDKAAAELRARIRNELAAAVGEDRAAEVDAAQISTIHSLAARICRDFYDLADIPADFRLLDETESEIVLAEWFDEAMAAISREVVEQLGYTWLRTALRELYKDPPAAKSALKIDIEDLKQLVEDHRNETLKNLIASDCWAVADDVLNRYEGVGGDKLEPFRAAVVSAMQDIGRGENIAEAIDTILAAKINVGSKGNWPDDSLPLVKECIKKLREAVGQKGDFASVSLSWSKADDEMYRRIELLCEAFDTVFDFIQSAKLDGRILDFADLEHYSLKILENPSARKHYAERWKAILVDEFQDTNPVQEKLLQLLTENGARLTIVGDGKQSIYGFRRADARVFERFRQSINNDVVLDRTFRTHTELVLPLNTVFENLLADEHQPLNAERIEAPHDGPFIEPHSFCDDQFDIAHMRRVEGQFIAGEIKRIIAEGLPVWDKSTGGHRPIRPADIAIISRMRAPLDIYIDELIEADIPAVNAGGGYLLDTRVAKDLLALLRFCSDPTDDIALAALLRGPFFAVDDVTLYKLSTQKEKNETWWQLLTRERSTVERPYEILSELLGSAKQVSATRLIEIADEMIGYTAVISNLKQGDRRLADWFGFVALVRKFGKLGRSDVVGADRYLKDLQRAEASIPRPPIDAGNAVSLMTIHAAKGLEWPVVFVPNLSADKRSNSSNVAFDAELGVGFKTFRRQADGKFVQEEPAVLKLFKEKKKRDDRLEAGRILYVAMTRARDRLYLTSAGKDAGDFAALIPGLESASVEIQHHDAAYQPTLQSAIEIATAETKIYHEQLSPIAPRFDSIPVTGLVDYSICPKRFKYRYVDGHPGATDGAADGASTDARVIGTLTHTALEMDIDSIEELSPYSDGASGEVLKEAIRLARIFRDGDDFSSFRLGRFTREVNVNLQINGTVLSGKADLVGDDWVLDYKTDSESLPEEHAVQLWAYAQALNKKRAIIAYLRHNNVYEYTNAELNNAGDLAERAVKGIAAAQFIGTPSEKACRRCAYLSICDECK